MFPLGIDNFGKGLKQFFMIAFASFLDFAKFLVKNPNKFA